MKDVLITFSLLVVSFVVTVILMIIVIPIKTILTPLDKIDDFYYKLAIHFDYIWGFMLFSADGHTVSALVYKRGNKTLVNAINLVFRDSDHCKNAYKKEFNV